MEKSEKSLMLVQSNAITEGRYQFDLVEKRIIYFIINEVRKKYVETNSGQRDIFNDLIITLPIEQLRKCDPNIKRVYESAKKLRKKDIEINNSDMWLNIGFINYSKHDKKTNEMELGVSKEILPYLVELTERFTTYSLTVSITLKSTYTQRFYELCNQWKNKGYFYYKLDNLRRILKCEDKFKSFGEFRRGVLDLAKAELEELYEQGVCDLKFDYGIMEKDGKRVVTLEFKITDKDRNKEKPVYSIDDYCHFIRSITQGAFPKDKDFVERILSACAKNYELAEQVSEKLGKKKNEYPAKEIPAILRYVLKEDFQIV